MDAHVGANGPGAIGKSSFTSGEFANAPIGTLSGGCGLEIAGSEGSEGKAAAETTLNKVLPCGGNSTLKDFDLPKSLCAHRSRTCWLLERPITSDQSTSSFNALSVRLNKPTTLEPPCNSFTQISPPAFR